MKQIGFLIPKKNCEKMRALLPKHLSNVKHVGHLVFEDGYGQALGLSDRDYIQAGAKIAPRNSIYECPVICNPKLTVQDASLADGKTLFGWIHAVQGRQMTDLLVSHSMTAIAWEEMYEGNRYLFWRNREIAGEAAVLHAFQIWGRFPYESKVAIIGRGMVATGAIRVLERLGCPVTIYNRETSPQLRFELDRYDVIVNAVLWDVFQKDHLIYREDLKKMRAGSMIIDISCDEAMGIESSRPTTVDDPVYYEDGVLHYAVDNTPTVFYMSGVDAISAAVCHHIDPLIEGRTDVVLEKATIIQDGNILDQRIIDFQGR